MKKIFPLLLLVTSLRLYGQENEKPESEVFENKHSLGITIGHENVFNEEILKESEKH